MIRISGGQLGGRILRGPVPLGVRPTSVRARAALFSMLGQDLSGWSWLDAFGGTGLMAFEAASRGAGPLFVAEREALAARAIAANAAALGVHLALHVGDARTCPFQASVVYLDPPYADPISPWITWAAERAERFVVAEARQGTAWPDPPEGFALDTTRRHGEGELALYERWAAL